MRSDSGIRPHGIQDAEVIKRRLGLLQFGAIVVLVGGSYGILAAEIFSVVAIGATIVGVSLLCVVGIVVYSDAITIAEQTDRYLTPSLWGVISVLVPVGGAALYVRRRHRLVTNTQWAHFEKRFDELGNVVSEFEAEIRPYLGVEAYLTYHHHKDLERQFEHVTEEFQQLRRDVEKSEKLDKNNTQLSGLESKLMACQAILVDREAYNDEFVEQELNRCNEFFSDLGEMGYSLNRQQREAVIRNDTFNRVIAGAGTGKTLVLTTRVAYLAKYQDVHPSEILVSTFTTKAAEEMQERLERDFGITGVEVTTLHSFGYKVIKERQDVRPDVFNDDDQMSGVPEKFYDHFTEFLFYSELPNISESDFESREEFVARLKRASYKTLRGESVKSRPEKLIADFLHTHQVEYRYEKRAEAINSATIDDDKDAYRPDFYIPSAEVYIEHFGIDENAEVAEWFSTTSEEYTEKIHWAREQFAEVDAELVETYQFEFDAGHLRRALEHRLSLHDVQLERLSYEELVDETYEIHEQDLPVWEKLSRFIELARTFQIAPGEIPDRLSRSQPAQYHFGSCGGLLLYMYEGKLRETNSVDFQDMIHQATQLLEGRAGALQYEHVLVDEFQDIGQDQLQLIEVLSGPDAARLFAVGDDWQSIYSFQGAVVNLFIEFEEYFGPAATSMLEVNYRSPAQLVEAGEALIQENDDQLEKRITADSDVEAAVVTHRLGGYNDWDNIEYTAELAVYLVKAYLENGSDPGDIMVLCRYDDAVPHLSAVRNRLRQNAIPHTGSENGALPGSEMYDSKVIVEAVHQVKGMEADHVIVTHVAEEGMGFPATDRDTELLEPVREVEMNTIAEERRLFYVAISRSIRTLDLVTKQGAESRFINEIEDFVDQAIDGSELVNVNQESEVDGLSARVAHLWDDTHHTKHQDGILEDHTDSIRFVSWANSNPPTLDEDTWYRFEGIRVNEYKGEPQVVVSGVTELKEIEPGDARVNIEDIHQHLKNEDVVDHSEPAE